MVALNTDPTFEVEDFFNTEVAALTSELRTIEDAANDRSVPEGKLVERFTAAFHRSIEACSDLEKKIGSDKVLLARTRKRFLEIVKPWYDKSWFFQRAIEKPRGYPGDYGMLSAIYAEEPKSEGFGRVLDRYFLQTDLARAVRTRLADVKAVLTHELEEATHKFRVLNVASGPGHEFSRGFENVSADVSITCLDTDDEALAYLKEHIDPSVAQRINFTTVNYNALKTVDSNRNRKQFGEVDMIYSVGLCDYIPDNFLIKMLKGWRETVRPGGLVYVAFKDALLYKTAEYQWQVDWHFFQRTEEDCRNLFEAAGYDLSTTTMTRDETNIIMNFVSRVGEVEGTATDLKPSGPHFKTNEKQSEIKSGVVSEDSTNSLPR